VRPTTGAVIFVLFSMVKIKYKLLLFLNTDLIFSSPCFALLLICASSVDKSLSVNETGIIMTASFAKQKVLFLKYANVILLLTCTKTQKPETFFVCI